MNKLIYWLPYIPIIGMIITPFYECKGKEICYMHTGHFIASAYVQVFSIVGLIGMSL